MRHDFTIGRWDISVTTLSRQPWTHMRLHRIEGGRHFVWGPISILIEDWTSEHYALCAQCDSPEIGEVSSGNEGWTVCPQCQTVEQGYRYVNKREYEALQ